MMRFIEDETKLLLLSRSSQVKPCILPGDYSDNLNIELRAPMVFKHSECEKALA